MDLALAHGLAWVGDRDLALVLPAGSVEPSRERVAFIDVAVSMWEWLDIVETTPKKSPG